MQRKLIKNRRFGTTYVSHIMSQVSFLETSPLKMGSIDSPETSAVKQPTLRNNP